MELYADSTPETPVHTVVLDQVPASGPSVALLAGMDPFSYAGSSATGSKLVVLRLAVNHGLFEATPANARMAFVTVTQQTPKILLSCTCGHHGLKLCVHQLQVLQAIISRQELRLFFDQPFRRRRLLTMAADYGMEQEPDPEAFFSIDYVDAQPLITPLSASLLPVTEASLYTLEQLLLPRKPAALTKPGIPPAACNRCLVLKQHRFYKHLVLELLDAPFSREGRIKNPLVPVDPQEWVWGTGHATDTAFYTALARFQQHTGLPGSLLDIRSLEAVVSNPLQLPVYYHDRQVSDNLSAAALVPVQLALLPNHIDLSVQQDGSFYELSATLRIGDQTIAAAALELLFGFFIRVKDTLYLVKDLQTPELIRFFNRHSGTVRIHTSGYERFRSGLLEKLESRHAIRYTYTQPATPAQLAAHGFTETEKIIYMEAAGLHVSILPVIRYGNTEVPVRSKRQVISTDAQGNPFAVQRDERAELDLVTQIVRQHPDFAEQLDNDLADFYLHRRYFLEEDWLMQTFEAWQDHDIRILGFNEISQQQINPNKARISVQVISGINWFNTLLAVRFGKQQASLKAIRKAVKDQRKFVLLDDGTKGILPAEWLERFTAYFQAADLTEADLLRTPKVNFSAVATHYDAAMLSQPVQEELALYQQRLSCLETLPEAAVPEGLQATLRPYQRQGLNWLNCLDELQFGGVLADDMGLGKTIQILAFILLQRQKAAHNTNLLVVPTSLLFNWQSEVRKFAPSIRVLTLHGASRCRNHLSFGAYEIILTSYGTLLSDIRFLKNYVFNYVFLDESQHIKNPESQRYKAVCLLQARNRIAVTGTPFENNTFDIYGQLSFVCPGLLGSKKYFSDVYANPIDKFKVSKRTNALQHIIRPFILRRTKQQVATELPDKTETILYCEMGTAQRNIYQAYEKEFREFVSAITQEELPKKSIYVLKGLTRLRQICNAPALLQEETIRETASAKMDLLMEQLESKAPRHKILVFSQFVSMLEQIRRELQKRSIGFVWLTGSTRNREAVVDQFQEDPSVRVFLISLKAGGTGLNLTAADYVYLVDPWWNPAVENQAIDRSYRIGQHKNVMAVRLICTGTVEEKMLQLQASKNTLADKLIREDHALTQLLNKEDLLGLLHA